LSFVARYVIVVWATGRLLVRTRRDQPNLPQQIHIKLKHSAFADWDNTGYDLHQLAKLVDHYGDKVVKSATPTAAAT
jgi:hypothetical protein